MTPRIEKLNEKKLIGMRLRMSLSNNRTGELWKSFIPRKREIQNNLTGDVISMQVYSPTHFANFDPATEFEKWATVEVSDFEIIPKEMETFPLTGGMYAVFDYTGLSSDPGIFRYIFGTWLPKSDYKLDDRPHFEILGAKYKNNDPASEEEIWIPIRPKSE
ncbi:GyrI-like domain-containing protein [Algoriphagus terrigena]|uniref:GyrI-like domain-containing protein n=1 Tax=Algoriphagus terrigena TaxID=344884 RepID=UPI0003F9B01A|nr:GyrI-like domain-containing protein [Algoriphagus terrigena]